MSYKPWNNSPDYPIVVGSSGHTETIMSEEQLFRFLDKTCGEEVTDVIKYEIYHKKDEDECTGECRYTEEVAEEYQDLLRDIAEAAEELLEIKSVQSVDKVLKKVNFILERAQDY